MKNPIFNELIKLKLISKLNLVTISNKTRDKNIKSRFCCSISKASISKDIDWRF